MILLLQGCARDILPIVVIDEDGAVRSEPLWAVLVDRIDLFLSCILLRRVCLLLIASLLLRFRTKVVWYLLIIIICLHQ